MDSTAPALNFFGARVDVFGAQFTYGSFLMFGLFALFWYVLNWTAWGRRVYAVGDDKDAAELAGVRPVSRAACSESLIGMQCQRLRVKNWQNSVC